MNITSPPLLTAFQVNSGRPVGLFVLMLSLFTLAPAEQIFFDSLSGSSQVRLNTTAPSIQPGTVNWRANNNWKADGTYTLELSDPRRNRGAFLPFSDFSTPGLYTLSATISSVEGVTTSLGLTTGDVEEINTAHAMSSAFALTLSLDGTGDMAGRVVRRGSGLQSISLADFTYGQPTTVHLELDTRGDTWTASFWINNGNRSTIELDDRFKENGFTGVGFHTYKSATTFASNTQVVVDDFSLISASFTATEDQ